MRIVGGSSCFDVRQYANISVEKAWDFICLILPKLPIQVIKIDMENRIINCEDEKNKQYMFATKITNGQTEVVIDITTKVLRVYGMNNNTEQVDEFYKYFEHMMAEYIGNKICANCKQTIHRNAKFCPECGTQQ